RALQVESAEWIEWSCSSVSGPFGEQIAPGHYGYPRASELILVESLEGHLGHQITDATARPFLHLIKSNSQTSAGVSFYQTVQGSTEAIPLVNPSEFIS